MSHAFCNCTQLSIKLPLSVTHIEKDAFAYCRELKLEVPSGKKDWIESNIDDVQGHVFEYESNAYYVHTIENDKRTECFLHTHNDKKKRRSKELMESLGLSSAYNDDYFNIDDGWVE